VRVSKERSNKARFTDLDDATTRAGVEQMETLGLIAEGRAAEILDAPVLDGERPGRQEPHHPAHCGGISHRIGDHPRHHQGFIDCVDSA